MRGKVGEPFQPFPALHADGDRLQLLAPEELARRGVFGLLRIQQPVPEIAQRAGPLIEPVSLLPIGIEARKEAAHDHRTHSLNRNRRPRAVNRSANRVATSAFRWFQ